jgi:hypothetical protein
MTKASRITGRDMGGRPSSVAETSRDAKHLCLTQRGLCPIALATGYGRDPTSLRYEGQADCPPGCRVARIYRHACLGLNSRYREGDHSWSPKGRASPTAFAIRYTAVGDDRPPGCRVVGIGGRRGYLPLLRINVGPQHSVHEGLIPFPGRTKPFENILVHS